MLDVDVRGGDGKSHCIYSAVQGVADVIHDSPIPGQDTGGKFQPDDGFDGFFFISAHGGNAHLNLVNPQQGQQPGDVDLLFVGENHSGRLFPIPQRSIIYVDRVLDGRMEHFFWRMFV